MIEQTYSITRTHATWKPRVCDDDLPFFQCDCCGRLFGGITASSPAGYSGTGRTLVGHPPYAQGFIPSESNPSAPESESHGDGRHASALPSHPSPCCDGELTPITLVPLEDAPSSIELDYRIRGGFNNNAIECSWSISDDRYELIWVALKTFTGAQIKYVMPKKRSPFLFALADEDAYVYCDENPCLECTFMCKRGFVLYAGFHDHDKDDENAALTSFIVRMPLTRMSPYWDSRDSSPAPSADRDSSPAPSAE